MKININSEKHLFLLICLILALLFTIIHYYTIVPYEENDDVVMLLISSGTITGVPEPYLVFINIIPGHILAFLYTLFPSLEWYSLHLITAQIVSVSTILLVLLQNRKKCPKYILVSGIVLILATSSFFILRIQFTTTAYALAISGCFLLYSHIQKNKDSTPFISNTTFLASALLVWSSLVRLEAFIGTLLVCSPLFVLHFRLVYLHKVSVVLFIVIGICILFNKWSYYHQNDWRVYRELNAALGKIWEIDTPKAKDYDVKGLLAEFPSINQTDVDLLKMGLLTKNITEDVIEKLSDYVPRRTLRSTFLYDFNLFEKNLTRGTYGKEVILFILLMVAFIWHGKSWEPVLMILTFIFLFYLITQNAVAKERAIFGLIFAVYVFSTFFIANRFTSFKKSIPLLAVFGLVSLMYFKRIHVISRNIRNDAIKINTQLNCLDTSFTYFPTMANLLPEGIDVLEVSDRFKGRKVIFGAWLIGSPVQNRQLNRYISSNMQSQNEKVSIEDLLIHRKDEFMILEGSTSPVLKSYLNRLGLTYRQLPKTNDCKLSTFKIE